MGYHLLSTRVHFLMTKSKFQSNLSDLLLLKLKKIEENTGENIHDEKLIQEFKESSLK
jgi:hypothetical protein